MMKKYDPFFPNREEKPAVIAEEFVSSIFDVVRSLIPSEENPIKAKLAYTTPKGKKIDLVDITIK